LERLIYRLQTDRHYSTIDACHDW